MRLFDISSPIPGEHSAFVHAQKLIYANHEERAAYYAQCYGFSPEDLPIPRVHLATDWVEASTHAGTHMDAPWHIGPTSGGAPSKKIDQIPLEWCYGDGVVLDMRHKEAGEYIHIEDLQEALAKIGHTLKPGNIVLFRTDLYTRLGDPEFELLHPGLHPKSVHWMLDQGVKVIGVDCFSIDRPEPTMAEELKRGEKEKFFAAHYVTREREFLHIEKLANLDKLPAPVGFKVAAFPIKFKDASAGFVRAVAIFED